MFYAIKNNITGKYKTCDGTDKSGPRLYVKKDYASAHLKHLGPDWKVVTFIQG